MFVGWENEMAMLLCGLCFAILLIFNPDPPTNPLIRNGGVW
jgi:hypothetical protein